MKKKSKKKLKIILLIVAVSATMGTALWIKLNKPNHNSDVAVDQADQVEKINYNPPTDDEKDSGDTQKDITTEKEKVRNESQPSNSQNGSANVVITDAGQYDNVIEVRSFISNHYQDGTCKIKLQQGSKVVEKSTTAYRDASTTICTNPLIPRSDLPSSGSWTVTIEYTSDSAQGISQPKTFEVK